MKPWAVCCIEQFGLFYGRFVIRTLRMHGHASLKCVYLFVCFLCLLSTFFPPVKGATSSFYEKSLENIPWFCDVVTFWCVSSLTLQFSVPPCFVSTSLTSTCSRFCFFSKSTTSNQKKVSCLPKATDESFKNVQLAFIMRPHIFSSRMARTDTL